jgi:hypothetical protein
MTVGMVEEDLGLAGRPFFHARCQGTLVEAEQNPFGRHVVEKVVVVPIGDHPVAIHEIDPVIQMIDDIPVEIRFRPHTASGAWNLLTNHFDTRRRKREYPFPMRGQSTCQTVSETDPESLGAVPTGVPLITGPAVLTSCILLAGLHGKWTTAAAVIDNIALTGTVFLFAGPITRVLGRTGTKTVSKVAGQLLAAIAVMLIRKGITEILT